MDQLAVEFDGLKDLRPHNVVPRKQEDVNTLGHDDPCVEGAVECLAGLVEAIDEDAACAGLAEKREAAVIGEGNESNLTRAAVESLADGRTALHEE